MSNFNRKLLRVINKLEAEAIYLDHLSENSSDNSSIKAQQIGMSEGMILAANVLRKQFDFNRKKSLEEDYREIVEFCS